MALLRIGTTCNDVNCDAPASELIERRELARGECWRGETRPVRDHKAESLGHRGRMRGDQNALRRLKIPLILNEAVNIDEEGLLTHEFNELLHERPQSRLRHSWHQLVVQAALPE